MEKETKALRHDLLKICWYMRGSLSVTEAWNATYKDRKLMFALADENLKVAKDSGLSFF